MHQPLTIAKVRKETKITVPEGGWVILVSPNEPFSNHAEKRREVISKGMVNEDFEVLAVGRMDNKYADVNFSTAKEKKEQDDRLAKYQATLRTTNDEADKREATKAVSERDALAAAHKKRVEEISAENDLIRNKK